MIWNILAPRRRALAKVISRSFILFRVTPPAAQRAIQAYCSFFMRVGNCWMAWSIFRIEWRTWGCCILWRTVHACFAELSSGIMCKHYFFECRSVECCGKWKSASNTNSHSSTCPLRLKPVFRAKVYFKNSEKRTRNLCIYLTLTNFSLTICYTCRYFLNACWISSSRL